MEPSRKRRRTSDKVLGARDGPSAVKSQQELDLEKILFGGNALADLDDDAVDDDSVDGEAVFELDGLDSDEDAPLQKMVSTQKGSFRPLSIAQADHAQAKPPSGTTLRTRSFPSRWPPTTNCAS
jgi:hypothetical protein